MSLFCVTFSRNDVTTGTDELSPLLRTESVGKASHNHHKWNQFAGQHSYSSWHSSFQNHIPTTLYFIYTLPPLICTSSHLGYQGESLKQLHHSLKFMFQYLRTKSSEVFLRLSRTFHDHAGMSDVKVTKRSPFLDLQPEQKEYKGSKTH